MSKRRIRGKVRAEVIARDGLWCRICRGPIRPGRQHIDHIVPVHFGGDDSPSNLRVVHRFCNNSRGPHVGDNRGATLHSDAYVRRIVAAAKRLGHLDFWGENP